MSVHRQKLNHEFSQQFLTLFQQWDVDMQKAEEQEEKLAVGFQHGMSFTVFSQGGNIVVQTLKKCRNTSCSSNKRTIVCLLIKKIQVGWLSNCKCLSFGI